MERCCQCDGEGSYSVVDDDGEEREYECEECHGSGYLPGVASEDE